MGLTASQISAPAEAFSGLVVIDPYGAFWKLLLYFVTGLTILFRIRTQGRATVLRRILRALSCSPSG